MTQIYRGMTYVEITTVMLGTLIDAGAMPEMGYDDPVSGDPVQPTWMQMLTHNYTDRGGVMAGPPRPALDKSKTVYKTLWLPTQQVTWPALELQLRNAVDCYVLSWEEAIFVTDGPDYNPDAPEPTVSRRRLPVGHVWKSTGRPRPIGR